MDEEEKTIISRTVDKALKRQREWSGQDRREPPMISDGVRWLVGVAAPVIGALIVMYSTQQVLSSKVEAIKEKHREDMGVYQNWNRSISDRVRHLERGQ